MNDRQVELLEAAIDALEDGRDPLSRAFLVEHGVTLDECYALSDDLVDGARLTTAARLLMAMDAKSARRRK